MKILCPTDFSPAAINGVEYAAKLAQQTRSTLTLINVQPIYMDDGLNLFVGGQIPSLKEAAISDKVLRENCREISKTFNITCTHEVIPSLSSFENIVSGESWKYNLVVIGTNGVDNLYQLTFGTHSFRLAKKTNCPVLIIPEACRFENIVNIVFASDYLTGDRLLLQQLNQFLDQVKPGNNIKLSVLHVSEKDTPVSREVYHAFRNLTEEALGFDANTTIQRLVDTEEADAIEDFMCNTNGSLLALCLEEHTFLYRLFHRSLVKKLTDAAFANYPMLIFHK